MAVLYYKVRRISALFSWVMFLLILAWGIFLPALAAYYSYDYAAKLDHETQGWFYTSASDNSLLPYEAVADAKAEYEQAWLVFVLLFTFLCFETTVMLSISTIKLTAFRRKTSTRLIKLDKPRHERIHRHVRDIASRAGLETDRIVLWLDNSRHLAPSCTTRFRTIHLVCPLGLLELMNSDVGAFEAMIAHEFGHVLQRDATLWRTLSAAQSCIGFNLVMSFLQFVVAIICGIYLWIYYLSFGDVLSRVSGVFIVGAIYRSVQVYALSYIAKCRKRSEFGADAVALQVTSPVDVKRAISKYLWDRKGDDTDNFVSHPSASARLKNIAKFCSEWNLENALLRQEPGVDRPAT
jgi:Zn-dependent protease with chaperone function